MAMTNETTTLINPFSSSVAAATIGIVIPGNVLQVAFDETKVKHQPNLKVPGSILSAKLAFPVVFADLKQRLVQVVRKYNLLLYVFKHPMSPQASQQNLQEWMFAVGPQRIGEDEDSKQEREPTWLMREMTAAAVHGGEHRKSTTAGNFLSIDKFALSEKQKKAITAVLDHLKLDASKYPLQLILALTCE